MELTQELAVDLKTYQVVLLLVLLLVMMVLGLVLLWLLVLGLLLMGLRALALVLPLVLGVMFILAQVQMELAQELDLATCPKNRLATCCSWARAYSVCCRYMVLLMGLLLMGLLLMGLLPRPATQTQMLSAHMK
jgi:hypothetical protein